MTDTRSENRTIRVLICDDHPVVRDGLKTMLESQPGLRVVGQAGNAVDAARLAAHDEPDVALLDLRMPRAADGFVAMEEIRSRAPRCRFLVLSTYADGADVARALESGASGYLTKDAPREEIFAAVREAASGGTPSLPPSVSAALFERMRQPKTPTPSEREIEILELAREGMSNKEIAANLFISEHTVKTHINRILKKLDVPDRTAAVVTAMRLGFISQRPPEQEAR